MHRNNSWRSVSLVPPKLPAKIKCPHSTCGIRWKTCKKYWILFCLLQGEKLRKTLIGLYFSPDELPYRKNQVKRDASVENFGPKFTHLSRAGKTLFEMQNLLDQNGCTDLIIDIIIGNPNTNIFLQCIQLANSLLEGGNESVQVKIDVQNCLLSVFYSGWTCMACHSLSVVLVN